MLRIRKMLAQKMAAHQGRFRKGERASLAAHLV